MKKFLLFLTIAVMWVLVFAGNGVATIINPDTASYYNDDGTELFYPSQTVMNTEMWDFGETLLSFGFFYKNTPGTLIEIFGAEDETVNTDIQRANIDFDLGRVYDVDDNVLQSIFSIAPGGPIGFYVSIESVGTLYTVPSLNDSGLDAAATFPSISKPDMYLIGFEVPLTGSNVAFELTSGITPVPEPSTLLLLGSGLAGFAMYKRKKSAIKN